MAADVAAIPDGIMPRVVRITDNHDLTLRVFQYTEPLKAGEDGRDKIKAVVDFYITRETLIENPNSDLIKKLWTTPEFTKLGKGIINLDEHDPSAVEVILCAVYRKDEIWKSSALGREVIARSLDLDWEDLWEVVVSNRYLSIKSLYLNEWFETWYERHGRAHEQGSNLLYPCFVFNHAKGFMTITKNMVHDYPHNIEEHKSKEHKSQKHPDLRVPPRVFGKYRIHQIVRSD